MRKTIFIGYDRGDGSERHIVVDKINSLSIIPAVYEACTDNNCAWIVSINLIGLNQNAQYKTYGEAIQKYNEILDLLNE